MKNLFTRTIKSTLLFAAVLSLGAISYAQTETVYGIISGSADHTTLTAAIDAAGLDDDLNDPAGEFTVFAPDDDAFDALLTELGIDEATLLADPDLADILLYHVVSGATVNSGDLENGQIVTPMSTANTVKMTVTSGNEVYANQAMVNAADLDGTNGVVHSLDAVILDNETVVDVAIDNEFETLVLAVATAELLPVLTDPFAEFTVFAPTDDAFDALATELGITVEDILALPILTDVLTYHVLSGEVASGDITNGQIVDAVSTTNTLKLTKTADNDVFVNHAQVTLADVGSENGVVHVLDAVVLPNETVVDIAIDNDFNTLVTAVVTAELLPTLTNPFAEYTVFAPTDDAFDALATSLGITLQDILALPTLSAILQYHVLGQEVLAADINNGDKPTPLIPLTLKLTATAAGDVFVNQAEVTATDISSDNGSVHVLDQVLLPFSTVVDATIDNGLTTLEAALFEAELVPTLSNPFAQFTVFAPSNDAFDALAADLDVTLTDILALPNLADILLYHVVGGTVLSTDLTEGLVTTLNTEQVEVSLTDGVMINNATVVTADVEVDNGVAHVIDVVLIPGTLSTTEAELLSVGIYPNPATDVITLNNVFEGKYNVINMSGATVLSGDVNGGMVNVEALNNGSYILNVKSEGNLYQSRFIKK